MKFVDLKNLEFNSWYEPRLLLIFSTRDFNLTLVKELRGSFS